MSRIEVDDLVATFNGQHIGQEQIDIATLQAQLAQSLRSNPSPASYPSPIHTQSLGLHHPTNALGYTTTATSAYGPNNTPTSSPSPLWGPSSLAGTATNRSRSVSRNRSNSLSTGSGSGVISTGTSGRVAMQADAQADWDEMDEVEEELTSPTTETESDFDPRPTSAFSSGQYSTNNPSNPHSPPSRRRGSTHSNSTSAPFTYVPPHHQQLPSPSSFVSSDPFYIAAVHAQRSAPSASNAYIAAPIGFGSQFVAQSQRGRRWSTRPGAAS
ncbi:hypothetical protein BS47DRAFT_839710 [Hydnum rufescens UP504]|uniref:Uncharacterized protein n=1 Tax=Hydnum rufescens UP504 TaxID=1448309 RepID=A0A9P6AZK7_9AGAM|nr:hypothetical protein BS47DRAFT_839710 [Hydnum rufescens UP504]